MTLISAHKGGAEFEYDRENTLEAFIAATELEVDFVEMDVQRCADGTFVLCHDSIVESEEGPNKSITELTYAEFHELAPQFPTFGQALRVLVGKKKAHLDYKFVTPDNLIESPELTPEVEATKLAIEIMGAENIIVTTMEDVSVFVVRKWAKDKYPDLLVGLSLGRNVYGMGLAEGFKIKISELFPAKRFEACDANLMVCKYDIGRQRLVKWASERGLPSLVWTVDDMRITEDWLKRGDAWMITTNFPTQAIDLRKEIRNR